MRGLVPALSISATIGLLLAGCIVSDELTTLTIRPDGSASLVIFRSNIRSTETGAQGEGEVRRHVEAFDARQDPEMVRIAEAGGELLEASWIRGEHPRACTVSAELPSADALERYCSVRDETGAFLLEASFTADGARRRLGLVFAPPADFKLAEPVTTRGKREQQADGVSETRFAITEGKIVAERGFVVAKDGRSALLALDEIEELLRADPDRIELFLEWELERQ